MRAVVQDRYGPPEVLEHRDIPVPEVGDEDVLIRVRATGLNAADSHQLRGMPYAFRLVAGPRRPRHIVLGSDVAGVVEAVGAKVTRFRPGDDVVSEVDRGGLADLVAIGENLVGAKPAGLTYEQAAGLPMAGMTALQGLRDAGRLQAGQRVLINGAAGGVGHFAVQIAAAMGAEVTGVCSTRNVDLVRSLGAHKVVDYTTEDFAVAAGRHDVVLDIVGNRTLADCRRALEPKGRLVLVGVADMGRWLGVGSQLRVLAQNPFVSQRLVVLVSRRRAEHLDTLAQLVDAGQLNVSVERVYPFAEAVDAVRHVETGHTRGKVVVRL